MQNLLEENMLWSQHENTLKNAEPTLVDFGSSRNFVSWGALLFKIFPKEGQWAERECYYLNVLQSNTSSSILAMNSLKPLKYGSYKVIILHDLRTRQGGVSLWESLKNPVEELKPLVTSLEKLWQTQAFEGKPKLNEYLSCYEFIEREVNLRMNGFQRVELNKSIYPRHTASHGDLHLGQFLSTDASLKEYVLHDFEGVPFSDIGNKYFSYLWANKIGDIASLLRSIDYWYRIQKNDNNGLVKEERLAILDSLGVEIGDYECLSYAYLIRNLYEITYEEKHRPEWAKIPMAALAQSLDWVQSFKL